MKREELKEIIDGITKEQLDKIMEINGKDIETAKGEANTLKEQVTTLTQQIADRDKQLKDLKDATKDNEKLQNKISELEQANATSKTEYEKRIEALKKDNEIELKLRDAKAKNTKAVRALLGEGDLDEQIKNLRENEDTAFLFETTKQEPPKGTEPSAGGKPQPSTEPQSLAAAIGMALNKKG